MCSIYSTTVYITFSIVLFSIQSTWVLDKNRLPVIFPEDR